MIKSERQVHEFAPVYDRNSKILILGTFPSVKSRENHFYYGHPQNRFWKVLASLMKEKLPESIEEKKQLLLSHGIAIWDVIASCDIVGSSDSSIKNVVPCDLMKVLGSCDIKAIFANGKTAEKLYNRYSLPITGIPIHALPSTSPANAAFQIDRLLNSWNVICDYTRCEMTPASQQECGWHF